MNGDEAFAFAGPTGAAPPAPFLASKYVIDPAHLVTSAKEIALAIAQGYSASKAITLLETASDKANVSVDRMLFLAESQLEALSGAKAIAGEKAFETEIRAHLTSGEAALELARDVKTGEFSPDLAAGTIIGMAKEVLPGPAAVKAAHAVATLMDKMEAQRVAEIHIETIAKHNATLILAGVEAQIKAAGVGGPSSADIAAAAEVMELGLVKFTTPALAKVVKQFSTLDDTVAERAILERVEYSAVQEALAEKQVTSADANKWDALLDGRQPLTTVTKSVYKIADDLDDGTITATKAVALLKSLAASQKTTAADLLTRSGKAYVTADAALDLATLAGAA